MLKIRSSIESLIKLPKFEPFKINLNFIFFVRKINTEDRTKWKLESARNLQIRESQLKAKT
jgi:hypothetical protein